VKQKEKKNVIKGKFRAWHATMMRLLAVALFLALVNISSSSEVQQPNKQMINSDVMNKKLLPNVKHLLKDNSDGDRQRFLHLLDELEVEGYKFVNGKRFLIIEHNQSIRFDSTFATRLRRMQLTHFWAVNNRKGPRFISYYISVVSTWIVNEALRRNFAVQRQLYFIHDATT